MSAKPVIMTPVMSQVGKTVLAILFILFSFLTFRISAQEAVLESQPSVDTEQNQTEDIPAQPPAPEQETMKGLVLEVLDEGSENLYGTEQKYAVYKVRITSGSKKGEEVEITAGVYDNSEAFKPGSKVYVLHSVDFTGQDTYFITDYNRTTPLIFLAIVFVILVVLVSKKWGVASIIGLIYSFAVVFSFILPQISKGTNPVLIAILGALMIAPVTFYLSHGLNRKTTIALLSTAISLVITGLLAAVFVEITKLSGFGSEEALFLQYAKGGLINIRGLLLAGIILGTLGILDDVTISQAAVVFQLKKANPKLDATETFHMAMDVGHDHIASTINTLILIYTGAALPLLILFIDNPVTTTELINSEIIAEEIVRTLVSSIGLVLSVPITTLLAAMYYKKQASVKKKTN